MTEVLDPQSGRRLPIVQPIRCRSDIFRFQ
jgi:hypothetical protein